MKKIIKNSFKIDNPSRVFSTPGRDPLTPRAFFRPWNGVVSKWITPCVFFRQRNRFLWPLAYVYSIACLQHSYIIGYRKTRRTLPLTMAWMSQTCVMWNWMRRWTLTMLSTKHRHSTHKELILHWSGSLHTSKHMMSWIGSGPLLATGCVHCLTCWQTGHLRTYLYIYTYQNKRS